MRRIKSHTIEKFGYFRKYIEAYLVATKRLPNKFYIDAFAGSGKCILCDESCGSKGGAKCQKCGRGKLVDGSAMISLKTKMLFDGYIFIDISKQCCNELKKFVTELDPKLLEKILIKNSDSNQVLRNIYRYSKKSCGFLIFLDPAGPELEWETIKYLSKIGKADLFILYPYDMSLVRLTSAFKEKLNKFYGDSEWVKVYEDKRNFNPNKRRIAMRDYYINKLKEVGFKYVEYKPVLRQLRRGKSLYHLILASHHPAAKKIMKGIFNKELDGQQKLF